jgi:Ca2+-binding EF-hand superfamily protein
MSSKPKIKLQNKKVVKNGKTEIIYLEKFTETQIKLLRAQFDELDKDGTGTVGVDEIMQFHENIGQTTTREKIKEEYFGDDDGDMQLTFDEFVSRLALRDNAEIDEIVDAFLFFTEGKKYMDIVQLKSICMNMGDNKFSDDDFRELISLTDHLPSDKFEVEGYVNEWRARVSEN